MSPFWQLLAQLIKLPRAGDGIGGCVLAVDEDRVRRNGGQYRLCNKVSGRLQSEAFGVGRPAQRTFEPSRPIVSRGGLTGKEILNTVPLRPVQPFGSVLESAQGADPVERRVAADDRLPVIATSSRSTNAAAHAISVRSFARGSAPSLQPQPPSIWDPDGALASSSVPQACPAGLPRFRQLP